MITRLPEPSREIMVLLIQEGILSPKEIEEHIDAPFDAIRYALRRLIESGIIKRVPNLLDMRSVYYRMSTETELREIEDQLSRNVKRIINEALEEAVALS